MAEKIHQERAAVIDEFLYGGWGIPAEDRQKAIHELGSSWMSVYLQAEILLELKKLNNVIQCRNTARIPTYLRDIRRLLEKKKPVRRKR